MLTIEEGAEVILQALFHKVVEVLDSSKVDVISCWVCPGNLYQDFIQAHRFKPTGFTTHFGSRAMSGDVDHMVMPFDRWHLTMADSDAF